MYNKEQLEQMEPSMLLEVAASYGIKVTPNSDRENVIYDILDHAAIDMATAKEASAKRKRTRIAKKDSEQDSTETTAETETKKTAKKKDTAGKKETAAKKETAEKKETAAKKKDTEASALASFPKHRGRKSKAELAAIAAAQAVEADSNEEAEATDEAEEIAAPEAITDEEPTANNEELDPKMLEALQEKLNQHNEDDSDVWEGDPGDGTDFITVVDLPIEDHSAMPQLDIFDRPMAPAPEPQPQAAAAQHATTTAKNERYDFHDFITGNGVLEIMPDSYGFLRSSDYNYLSSPDDIYVSQQQIKKYSLKTGDVVECTVRPPHENEKFFALSTVTSINGRQPTEVRDRVSFENLTPLFPQEKFNLTGDPATTNPSTRIVDLFAPIGKGQRALIVAQPKTGKTILMKDIANAIAANHPEAYIMMLLIDERPEEVTDMARTVNAEVIASTFDEPAERHVKIAGIVLEKAKRMVECGHDVVIFLDSITRLARAYNTVAPASGKVLTGGVDANALQKPKRFFGAARKIENGGSLTIIATALVDTGSKMDEVIFEEFKGTGNSEIQLDRMLSNKRIFPALNLIQSSTRRDDLLQDQTTLNRMWIVRKFISEMNCIEAMNTLRDRIVQSLNNEEFLMSMNG